FPTEIVSKRTRVAVNGSKLLKVYVLYCIVVDSEDATSLEYKLDSFSSVAPPACVWRSGTKLYNQSTHHPYCPLWFAQFTCPPCPPWEGQSHPLPSPHRPLWCHQFTLSTLSTTKCPVPIPLPPRKSNVPCVHCGYTQPGTTSSIVPLSPVFHWSGKWLNPFYLVRTKGVSVPST
ncbi:hypothetical protein B0H11DRAFT_1845263, partial [Mycena galericulata]